jgi:RND family efflux transporter MFP subunit
VSDLKGELATLRIDRDRPQGRSWRWLVLLVIALAVVVGAAFALSRSSLRAAEVETVEPTIETSTASQAGAPVLTASGYVVARRKAVVSAKIQGRLSELRVEEGSRVREGEVIARLESTDYEAQVRRSKAAVARAEADLAENRRQLRIAQGLANDKVVSQDQLDAADSRVRMADAALQQAQADLGFAEASYSNTLIRAPFTGVVVKKMAEVGESVAPIPPGVNISTASGAIVALADLDTLEVEADVSESNVAKLGQDQPADVTVEAFPDRHYRAILRQVIPTADRTKATVQVKVTILDKDKDLKPEMSSKVTFLEPAKPQAQAAPTRPRLTVPKEAVAERGGKQVVLEVQKGKIHVREVTTAGERNGQVVVAQGLAGGETLVVRPSESLQEGEAVRLKAKESK